MGEAIKELRRLECLSEQRLPMAASAVLSVEDMLQKHLEEGGGGWSRAWVQGAEQGSRGQEVGG